MELVPVAKDSVEDEEDYVGHHGGDGEVAAPLWGQVLT